MNIVMHEKIKRQRQQKKLGTDETVIEHEITCIKTAAQGKRPLQLRCRHISHLGKQNSNDVKQNAASIYLCASSNAEEIRYNSICQYQPMYVSGKVNHWEFRPDSCALAI